MFNIIKSVIDRGKFDLPDILDKIKTSYIIGDITEEQCQELQNLAQSNAKAEHSTDVIQKLIDLERRVLKLEALLKNDEESAPEEAPEGSEATYPEFASGKWYYGGDRISFEGKNYECTAPEGTVCVWNPKDYPAYWSEIE
jgi:hypothetical protein